MDIEKDIRTLQMHEAFGRFIKMVHQLREETIQELHESDNQGVQQTAGRIISYDQILQLADWELLQKRFSESL